MAANNLEQEGTGREGRRSRGRGRVVPTPMYLAESSGRALGRLAAGILRFLWRSITALAVVTLAFGSVVGVLGGYFYLSTVGEIPVLENPEAVRLPQDSTIYDVDGKVIGVISSQRRYIVSGSRMGDNVRNAMVSIEDERFFDHEGVDLIGIARAIKVNYDAWRSGDDAVQQGGSTITQQYVRTVWLSNEVSLQRKFKEIALAVQLEARLSKSDILNRYLNTVYFGNGNYGAEAAARYYFGKSSFDLDPYEAAILVSCINNPTIYDPTTEEGRISVKRRAGLVLDKMYQLGYLESAEEIRAYKETPVEAVLHIQDTKPVINEPYYYDYVREELFREYGKEEVLSGGWQVYTTLSIARAGMMERAARDAVGSSGVAVSMADVDPRTGAINAFLGGWDWAESNFNLATQGRRQPGSAFKPFVYAAAFRQGYRNDSPFSNAPLSLPDGEGKTWEVVPDSSADVLQEGLAYSDNAMAVRVILETGIAPVIDTARRLGITSEINEDNAIALGGLTYGVSPLEMASAYASFANAGIHCEPYAIDLVTDKLGNTVYQHSAESSVAVNAEVAAMMNLALRGVVEYGTAADTLSMGRPVAGKTGTTDNHADTWFVGYTPEFAASVWMGYPDSNRPIPDIGGVRAWGGTFTARIWQAYAEGCLEGVPASDFPGPQGVVEVPRAGDYPTAAAMKAALQRLGLRPAAREVQDPDRQAGTVLAVDREGDLVPLGSRVGYDVAVQKYAVPDFTGMSPYEAVREYGALFSLKFTVSFDDAAPADGSVTGQDVRSGSLRERGQEVRLAVDVKTPPPDTVIKEVQIPYIPSETEYARLQARYEDALDSLAAARAESDALRRAKSALEGRFIPMVPNVVGLPVDEARALLEGMGYAVQVQGAGPEVSSQSPAAGTVPAAATVTLAAAGTVPPPFEEIPEQTP